MKIKHYVGATEMSFLNSILKNFGWECCYENALFFIITRYSVEPHYSKPLNTSHLLAAKSSDLTTCLLH